MVSSFLCLQSLDDDEEEVIPRKQVSNRNNKRALDDDEESFKDEESKGHSFSDEESLNNSSMDESDMPAKNKKKPVPARKSATSSTTVKKAPVVIGDGKKRVSDQSNAEEQTYVDQEDQFIGGGFQSLDEILDARPPFIKESNVMDLERRRPDDTNYDPTSLHIPASEWKNFTPCMTQYWHIKTTNYEKILFFKLGKFYEIFYNDAIICQKLLDLNWMGGAKKLHVGFPEKVLDKYLSILVNNGFKVAVVEQTETPKQLEERMKKEKGKKEKCVSREVCNVFTKGTFKDTSQTASYEPRFVLALKRHGNEIGVSFFDISTLKFYIGQFFDDEPLSNFRTLVC